MFKTDAASEKLLRDLVARLAEMPFDLSTKRKRIGSGRMGESTVVVAGRLGIFKNVGISLMPMCDVKGSSRANQINGDVIWILHDDFKPIFVDVKATNRVSENSLEELRDGNYFAFGMYMIDPGHEYFVVKKTDNFVKWVKNHCAYEQIVSEDDKAYKMYTIDYQHFCLSMEEHGLEQLKDLFAEKSGPAEYTDFLLKINVMLEELRPTYNQPVGNEKPTINYANLKYRVPTLTKAKLDERKKTRKARMEQKIAGS